MIALLVVLQLVVWTLVPFLASTSMPLDVVSDGLSWGHEWQLGYYKHPPLPAWLVELAFNALGDLGPYLLSQIAIVLTYGFVFMLGRELMDDVFAAAGTILLAGVTYFSLSTPEFNNNVAQMPAWAAMAFFFHRSVRRREFRWWIALGLSAGIGLMMKYSTSVLMLAMFAYMLSDHRERALFATPGPYLALTACALAIAPHVVWLVQHDFSSIRYAQHRAGSGAIIFDRKVSPILFLAAQALATSPALFIATGTGFLRKDSLRNVAWKDPDFRFLLIVGLGPVVLATLLSVELGMGLRAMWGMPMANLTGLLIAYLAKAGRNRVQWKGLMIATTALFAVMPAAYVLSAIAVPVMSGKPSRSIWPDRALADTFERAWTEQTGRPLRIVAGDSWLAGLVAMRSSSRPSVLIDGNLAISPWITAQAIQRDGVLAIWQVRSSTLPPAAIAKLDGLKVMGVKTIAWPYQHSLAPLRVGWGIVFPHDVAVVAASSKKFRTQSRLGQ
ncbi:MAG: glycosyltransferase family 39 protein [Proteobacteria bacterium]|nr:glycosyltransferase family 39 protein [Pseudomonadota bacterium]